MAEDVQERLDAIRDHVRAGGRRWTFAKNAIVATLLEAERHLSPKRIYENLLPRFPQLDHSTVYRALQVLVEEGVVHSLDRPGEARYGLADRPHHHVVCSGCGRVAEVDAGAVQDLLVAVGAEIGFTFDRQGLTLTGRCERCAVGKSNKSCS